jgi:hypothetical protein
MATKHPEIEVSIIKCKEKEPVSEFLIILLETVVFLWISPPETPEHMMNRLKFNPKMKKHMNAHSSMNSHGASRSTEHHNLMCL